MGSFSLGGGPSIGSGGGPGITSEGSGNGGDSGGGGGDWLSWGIPAGAAIGGGIANYFGQQSTNAANAAEAQKNRDWQEKMTGEAAQMQMYERGTRYQATVQDLKAAGLNPMLAINNGASAASGTPQASGVGNPTMENAVAPAVGTAMSGLKLVSDIKNQAAQQNLWKGQATLQAAQAIRETANAKQLNQQTKLMQAEYDTKSSKAKLDKEWQKWDKWSDFIGQNVGTITNAVNPVSQMINAISAAKARSANTQMKGLRGVSVP